MTTANTITLSTYAINVGAAPNDGTGDDLRTAFQKVNATFGYMANTGFSSGNINASSSTIQAAYFVGDGSQLVNVPGTGNNVSNYGNANVAVYLPTYTGNVNATYYFGNGSQLTGIPSAYGNTQVTAYLTVSNIGPYSNTNVIAYITTNSIGPYANTNVAAYLPTYSGNSGATLTSASQPNITTVGNLANLNVTGQISTIGIIYSNNVTNSTSVGTGALVVAGGVGIAGNLTVNNVTVKGTFTTVNTTSLNLSNSIIFLNANSVVNTNDIGFTGQYNAGQGNVWTGLAYHAADGIYRLFSNVNTAPTSTVTLTYATYASLQLGNLIAANVGGTLTTASQPYVTSLGNLVSANASGNISTTNYVNATYFTGNGSLLTGIYGYSNVNLAAYLTTNTIGPYANANVASYLPTYSGNITGYSSIMNNGFVSTGSYIGAYTDGIILDYVTGIGRISAGTADGFTFYNNANVSRNALFAIDQYGNVTAGNIYTNILTTTSGNLTIDPAGTADLVISPYTEVFIQSNAVTTTTSTGALVVSGGIGAAGAANIAGNITTGSYFIGNGSLLSGIVNNYSNGSVASYLPIYSGNLGGLVIGNQNYITGVGTLSSLTVNGAILATTVSGNAAQGNTSTTAIGYMNLPQNPINTSSYVLSLSDQGKHVFSTTSTTANIYIPTYANVPWPIGTSIEIVVANASATTGNVTIVANVGVTLFKTGNTTSGANTRVINTSSISRLLNIANNIWLLDGNGVT